MATEAQAPPQAAERSEAGSKPISVGLLLIMVALLLRVVRLGHGTISGGWVGIPTAILGFAVLLFIANLFVRPQQRSIRFDAPLKILIVFLGWQMITLLWARWPERALPSMMSYIVFVLGVYFLVLGYTDDWCDLDRWAMMYAVMAIVIFVLAWHDRSIGWHQVAATTGLLYIGRYARSAIEALPFTLHLALWGRDRPRRILGGIGLLAALTAVFWTARRTAVAVTLLIGLIYGCLIARRQRQHLLILLAVIAVMATLVLTNPTYMSRMREAIELDFTAFDNPRVVVWVAAFDAAREHWLLGMGAFNFQTWIQFVWGYPEEFYQHNLTLQLLNELGLPGLFIFGAFVLVVVLRVYQALRLTIGTTGPTTLQRVSLHQGSMLAAALSSFIAMLFYAQTQPLLLDTQIFVPAALCSVAAELVLRRSPAASAVDGTAIESVDVHE